MGLTLCDPMDCIACQAPLSLGFSRQEYWSGLPCLLQGIFPTQRLNPDLPHCRQILYCLSHQESPWLMYRCLIVDFLGRLGQSLLPCHLCDATLHLFLIMEFISLFRCYAADFFFKIMK